MIKGQKVKENNMSNYVISCCSTADLTREHMLERNIKYACFHYELDGKEYMDEESPCHCRISTRQWRQVP